MDKKKKINIWFWLRYSARGPNTFKYLAWTTVIFFSAWDKLRINWDNSRNSTKKMRTCIKFNSFNLEIIFWLFYCHISVFNVFYEWIITYSNWEYQNFCQTLYIYLLFQSASSSIGKLGPQKNNKTFKKATLRKSAAWNFQKKVHFQR